MKGYKALYRTKDDLSSNIILKHIDGSNQVYGNAKGQSVNLNHNHDANKDLDIANNIWSHLSCACADTYRENSCIKTTLSQVQSKVYNDVGVGNVKRLRKKKLKKPHIPKTQERAVGTFDWPSFKNSEVEDFDSIKKIQFKTLIKTDRSEGNSFKRFLLNKKLSPFFKTKSIYANPEAISLRNKKANLNYKSFESKFVNATTQLNYKELSKPRKVKIFKEFAVNTDSMVKESASEPYINLSTVLNIKNPSYVNSLDSLVQHIYNLDKQRFEGNLSRILIDPMENILEREYRKIFSVQSRNCLCIKDSASDSLLRRFEALRGNNSTDVLLKNSLKISSQSAEPSYKEVSIISDPASLKTSPKNHQKNSYLSPNDISEKSLVKGPAPKINTRADMRTRNSSKLHKFANKEGDNHEMKRIFKLWGRKQSKEGDIHKKSKIKCCVNKRSERSTKSVKLSNNQSVDKKERKKFLIFKKRYKECTIELIPKKVITSGRCEIRQELILKIGNTPSKQNHQLKFVGSVGRSIYHSLIDGSDFIVNDSNKTNTLLFNTANTTSLLHQGRSSVTNFSRQYVQAWIIPNIILDKFVKAKVKCNLKYNKHKSCDSVKSSKCLVSKQKTSMANNKAIFTCNTCPEKKLKSQSKCIMFDIALSRSSENNNNSYINKDSDEKVYNIVDYETSFPNSIASKKIDLKPDFNKRKRTFIDTHKIIHIEDAESTKHVDKQVWAKAERLDKSVFLNNNSSIQNTHKTVGVETVTQRHLKNLGSDARKIERDSHIDSFYPTATNNLKFTEIYLRKLYQDWIPNEVDSECTNNFNFRRNLIDSLQNVQIKKENLKSTTDGIRFTTLLSSYDAAGKIGQENTKHEEINKSKKLSRHKRDNSKTNAEVRILPKDSLEVFKKRKLYLNSNRTKWKCGNELLISVSSCNEPLNIKSPKSVKIHQKPITILEDDMVDNALQNKELTLPKEVQTDSAYKKIKYGHKTKEKSPSEDENENHKLLIKKCSKSEIKEFNLTSPRPIKENFFLPPQNSIYQNTESNIQSDKNETKSVSKDVTSNNTSKCAQKDKSYNELSNKPDDRKNTEIKACTSSKHSKSYFKIPAFTKIRKQFLVDKKYSNEILDSLKKGTKRWSNITDMLRISPLAQTFARSDTTSSRQNCFTATKSRSKLLGFHFKKRPVVKNASKSCSTGHICECKSIDLNNETKVDNKVKKKNDAIAHKGIVQTTNTPCYLHGKVSHVCNKPNESKSHLIEINLKVKPKQGENKNIVISINESSQKCTKEQKKEDVINCTREKTHLPQDKSDESLRLKTSKFFLNVRILIKNCKHREEINTKKSKTSKISKQISQKLRSTSSDMGKNVNNNPCSVHKCTVDLTNSLENVNECYKNNENFTLLKLQNKDMSKSNDEIVERMNDVDTVSESLGTKYNKNYVNNNSIIKQRTVFFGHDNSIESYNLNPKLRKMVTKTFKCCKTASKPSIHFGFYNKILSRYQIQNKLLRRALAQQTTQRIFEKGIKENIKVINIKESANVLQSVTSCNLSETNHTERLVYEALQHNYSTIKPYKQPHSNSILYSDKKNNVRFHNYYCNTVPLASKRCNPKGMIFKSESCLCAITVENSEQDLKNLSRKQESCDILSSNINDDGDGNPLKLILPLVPDSTNSPHQSNDKSSPVGAECKFKDNVSNKDIFELAEIKKAVLEMYVTEKDECGSDIFSTLPEVISEVENVLMRKTLP